MTARKYRFTVVALAVAGLAYTMLSEIGRIPVLKNLKSEQQHELFPFFNWSLFSYSHKTRYAYHVRVLAAEETSRYAAEIGRRLQPETDPLLQNIRLVKTAHSLGYALAEGDEASAEDWRRLIDNFMRAEGVTAFEVIRIEVDTLRPYDRALWAEDILYANARS
ncbi:MAG: hypothetical protein AAGL49_12800 [Pseudomonadota bacterium]